jgi:hypothetical protein
MSQVVTGADRTLPCVGLKVALVSRDPAIRLAGAKAFETAPDEWIVELCETAPSNADVVVCGPDVPECTGLLFDPTQPAAVLELIEARCRRHAMIAVASACGGCGVTTIALHLARSHGSCCVVEHGGRAGLAERLALERTELKTRDADGDEPVELAALPMPAGFRAMFATDAPDERVLEAAVQRFERVVVDVSAGANPPGRCDVLVAVMPATLPGARRTRVWLDGLRAPRAIAVVANRLGGGGEATRAELQRVLGHAIAVELPHCRGLRDAEDHGALLPSRHRWARRVAALAGRLRARIEVPV